MPRDYLGMVASLPCCVYGAWPVEVHHRTGAGMAMMAPDTSTMPLSPVHHRSDGYGVAIHSRQKTWERKFGSGRPYRRDQRIDHRQTGCG
ncbi:DUF968 domain-containing protein [Tardiphaga sp. 619_E2_N8_5]|uniref:DUF968 domain-containing protein n=1 Tax=unclassified Tardiphaga TaxID=2631404 RepID=UPI003F282EBF